MKIVDPKYLDIEDLPAGPDLDSRIAREVFGRTVIIGPTPDQQGFYENGGYRSLPQYSTRMQDAWEIVQFMRERSFDFDFYASSTALIEGWADAIFLSQVDEFSSRAKTAQLAICRSALKAVHRE